MNGKMKKVYLYFLKFDPSDIQVFYDSDGIAAVTYCGSNVFLQNESTIQFCFEEGYVIRNDTTAFILYAYTKDQILATKFELLRNMRKFLRKTVELTEDEYENLKRFREGRIYTETLLYKLNTGCDVTLTVFEAGKVLETTDWDIIGRWDEEVHATEFLVFGTRALGHQDDLLSEELISDLIRLRFDRYMHLEESCPEEPDIAVNELNLFCEYFGDTLVTGGGI